MNYDTDFYEPSWFTFVESHYIHLSFIVRLVLFGENKCEKFWLSYISFSFERFFGGFTRYRCGEHYVNVELTEKPSTNRVNMKHNFLHFNSGNINSRNKIRWNLFDKNQLDKCFDCTLFNTKPEIRSIFKYIKNEHLI